jgi:hypothetical protein
MRMPRLQAQIAFADQYRTHAGITLEDIIDTSDVPSIGALRGAWRQTPPD